MQYPVDAYKQNLVAAIQSLPDDVPRWENGEKKNLVMVSIRNQKQQSLGRIQESERLWALFDQRKVIALVGNVNAGKSSLGNLLLGKQPSEVFPENDIRETSQAKIVDFGEQVLIDLPGLGSVLSEQDDRLVEQYVSRADLLILVQNITSDIDPNLYAFLQRIAGVPQLRGQRILLVLNKIDNLAPPSRERILGRYLGFLLDGDPEKGFGGIRRLFNYEIPVFPFSVDMARTGELNDRPLQDALRAKEVGNGHSKAWEELQALGKEWDWIAAMDEEIHAVGQRYAEETERKKDNLGAEMDKQSNPAETIRQVMQILDQVLTGSITDFSRLPGPNMVERARKTMLGEGPNYIAKKNAFEQVRGSGEEAMKRDYQDALQTQAGRVGQAIRLYYPRVAIPGTGDIDAGLLNAYLQALAYQKEYYQGKLFGEPVSGYTHRRNWKKYRAGIQAGYQKTLNSYTSQFTNCIAEAYLEEMGEYDRWMAFAKPLDGFRHYREQMTALVNGAGKDGSSQAAPLKVTGGQEEAAGCLASVKKFFGWSARLVLGTIILGLALYFTYLLVRPIVVDIFGTVKAVSTTNLSK